MNTPTPDVSGTRVSALAGNELRAKFQALREFVETIPAQKLDMRRLFSEGDCGCVIGLASQSGASGEVAAVDAAISPQDSARLFEYACTESRYPVPVGRAAKKEFLRRLSALEAKYCGPTPTPSVSTDPATGGNVTDTSGISRSTETGE